MEGRSAGLQLLQWLDEQHGSSGRSVIESVTSQLQGSGLDAGALYSTAAAAPISLQIDVTALASTDATLAMELLSNTGQLEVEAAALINQQLATMHPAPDPQDDMPTEPPTVRVSLQMQQVPLPLSTVPEVVQQVIAHRSQHSRHSFSTSGCMCVSLLSVVTGLTPPSDVCYSQRFHCPSCGRLTDALTTQPSLPCCNIPKTEWLKEDITGRVMVQTQQLWVSELSCATGRSSYGCSSPALRVILPEHLAGTCSLGSVVHIIGHASCGLSTASGGGCCIQIKANNVQAVVPHITWTPPPAAAAPMQQPLHQMWELLTAALGYNTAIDPHVAVAMLLSAAVVGSGSSATAAAPRQSEQVNLLILHEAFSPATPRLLREAAALLSPQSVAMPVQQAEHVTPITGGTDTTQTKALFASILQLANSGIASAELALMTTKSRTQLLQALQQRQTPMPKDIPQGLMLPPLTATCWAAASWQEVCSGPNHDAGGGGRPAGRRGAGAAGDRNYHGFDLCIGDGTVHEDDIWGMLDIQAASAAEQAQLQQSQQEAAASLRQMIAGAAGGTKPVLSDAAQAFLGQYFLMVRQSVDGSSHVSKPHLLASVVATATAAARLHQRSTVLECPDATLAVVLTEHTLANKLGDAYHSLLELPCDLQPVNDRTLDEQLVLLHDVISRAFKQSGFTTYGEVEGDGGCAGGMGEESGDSGCNGGVCGGGDDMGDVEE